jgi:gamma-glutamyl:cysteine ligase YbdK (ATP-grasp superfamily)
MASEKQKQGATAVGFGDWLGHINVPTSNKVWRIITRIELDAPHLLAASNRRELNLN